ncbi:MAG: M23 family metallopeptidase, partial [Anaerolineae bacterium]
MERPIGPEGQVQASRFYPYGTTASGRYLLHHGVDIKNPIGTPILAVASGTVIVAGTDQARVYGPKTDFYGQLVVVQLDREFHGQPVFVLYGHLSRVMARLGQRVTIGEVLGEVGMTGIAIGPHLHFEVRVGANAYTNTRNPDLWLKPLPGHGTIAGQLLDARGNPIPEALVTFHRAEEPDRRWRETWNYA